MKIPMMVSVHAVLCLAVFLSARALFAAGEPDFLATKATLWLDASKPETVLTNQAGGVTNWISRDASAKVAKPGNESYLPIYEATNGYAQTCVDFGDVGSLRDMCFGWSEYKYAFFAVKIRQNVNAFLLGDAANGTCNMHRGLNGTWFYTGQTHIQTAWQDAVLIGTDLLTTLIPEDDFYVLTVRMDKTCGSNSLTSDRNIASRNGGRQLSEVILVKEDLSEDDIMAVTQYLLRKWKLARKLKLDPSVVLQGMPQERGPVSPDYGTHTDFVKGQSYTFKSPAAITNDSQSLKIDRTSWRFVKTDYSIASGNDDEVSFTYGDDTSHSVFTWYWTDWYRLSRGRGAFLPKEYRCLQYVEVGTFKTYINTGITLTSETTDVLFTVGASESADYDADTKWLGNYKAGAAHGGDAVFSFGRINKAWSVYADNGNMSFGAYTTARDPMTVLISDNRWFLFDPASDDGLTSYDWHDCAGKTDAAAPLGIFAMCGTPNLSVTSYFTCVGTRVYQVEVFEGATCAHKLIAAQRRSDNAVGFYDVVTDQFHTNDPTLGGTLVAGPPNARYSKGLMLLIR